MSNDPLHPFPDASLEPVPLSELLRLYADVDEIVFTRHCGFDGPAIADLCRSARRLAHSLRSHYQARSAAEVARIYGIEIVHESWQVAEDRVLYLAECTLRPPKISLNAGAIGLLAERMHDLTEEGEKVWFTEAKITEVALAHELYHIIEQRSSRRAAELAAHAFAREFAGLLFSPLLYGVLLARVAKGRRRGRMN